MRVPAPHQYSLLDVARAFMVAAHCGVGQVRKYSGEDYFHHPEEVLQLLLSYDDPTLEMQVAALLHDVVEDTNVTLVQIRRIFGMQIASLVEQLTEVSKPEDGNRAARKQKDLEHLAGATPEAMRIKCADLMSNSKSIVERDVSFAKTYLVEKLRMLAAMHTQVGLTLVWQEAARICVDGVMKIWPEPEEALAIIQSNGFPDITLKDLIEYGAKLK